MSMLKKMSYAVPGCKFELIDLFVNGAGYEGINQVKRASYMMFLQYATLPQLERISGFKCVVIDGARLKFMFRDRELELHTNNVDAVRFERDSNYRSAILHLLCSLMIPV